MLPKLHAAVVVVKCGGRLCQREWEENPPGAHLVVGAAPDRLASAQLPQTRSQPSGSSHESVGAQSLEGLGRFSPKVRANVARKVRVSFLRKPRKQTLPGGPVAQVGHWTSEEPRFQAMVQIGRKA